MILNDELEHSHSGVVVFITLHESESIGFVVFSLMFTFPTNRRHEEVEGRGKYGSTRLMKGRDV